MPARCAAVAWPLFKAHSGHVSKGGAPPVALPASGMMPPAQEDAFRRHGAAAQGGNSLMGHADADGSFHDGKAGRDDKEWQANARRRVYPPSAVSLTVVWPVGKASTQVAGPGSELGTQMHAYAYLVRGASSPPTADSEAEEGGAMSDELIHLYSDQLPHVHGGQLVFVSQPSEEQPPTYVRRNCCTSLFCCCRRRHILPDGSVAPDDGKGDDGGFPSAAGSGMWHPPPVLSSSELARQARSVFLPVPLGVNSVALQIAPHPVRGRTRQYK